MAQPYIITLRVDGEVERHRIIAASPGEAVAALFAAITDEFNREYVATFTVANVMASDPTARLARDTIDWGEGR